MRFVADENFDRAIVQGLIRRSPEIDIVRVQDVGLSGADDPSILEWAAREYRILLTHDVGTMTMYAYDRIRAGQAMPGVFEVTRRASIGRAIADILLLIGCSHEDEWSDQVCYIPLSE